jgi:Xaa-Pro aminopeptidase
MIDFLWAWFACTSIRKKTMKIMTTLNQKRFKGRIVRLFEAKDYQKLSAILLTAQPNIFYFTGFTGEDSWALLTPKKTILITDGRFDIQSRQESPQARVIIRKGPIAEALGQYLASAGLKKIGIIGDEVSITLMSKLASATKKNLWFPVSADPILALRQIKDTEEIKIIKRAIIIAQTAFLDLLDDLEPGRTEREVAAELDYRMRAYGAEKPAFDTIVACGENSAKPHARLSTQKLTIGKPIIFDFGARLEGYCSDLTRTVYLGKMPPCFKKMYMVCLEAQLRAIEAVKPGIPAADVDHVARAIISRADLGKYFNHGLGHGVGLDIHEAPALSGKSRQILEPGMVVTVEPGIYIPGQGGVRIEDDVLVTETGGLVLSSLPKNPDQVVK